MSLDWLKSTFQRNSEDRALESNRKELRRYIDGIKTMPDEDIGVILAVATVIRVNMENEGFLPQGLFRDEALPSPNDMGKYQMELNQLVRDFNRIRQPTDAVGTLVISYSLQCLNVADLRGTGRAMWSELKRGLPHTGEALKKGEEEKGEPFDKRVWQEWHQIPVGLEPDEA